MQQIDISKPQRLAIHAALKPHAGLFDAVGVFGSRATGKAQPGSDIDLVVYGTQNSKSFYVLKSAIVESDLSIFADVIRYEDIRHQPLKNEVDTCVQILFDHQDFYQTTSIEANQCIRTLKR